MPPPAPNCKSKTRRLRPLRTLYTVHCTLYTVHCTLYTVHLTPLFTSLERVLADRHLGREERRAEVFAVGESVRSDRTQAVVPLHLAQAPAVEESTVADRFERSVEVDFLQVDTLRKSAALDGLQGRRQTDFL